MKDFREVEPGVWSVLEESRSFEVRISGNEMLVNGTAVPLPEGDVREWDRRARGASSARTANVQAPMPGKVVRVLVAVGDEVKSGQGVVVVEAMKMQNELKSPRDGRVASINAKEHDTVNAGFTLVTIE